MISYLIKFLNPKFIIVVLGIVAISGFFIYQKWSMETLNDKIQTLSMNLGRLKEENKILMKKYSSVKSALDKAVEDMKKMEKFYENVIASVTEAERRLGKVEKSLSDAKRRKRIDRVLSSGKDELLMRYFNKNVKCLLDNFYKQENGTCIVGKFKVERDVK